MLNFPKSLNEKIFFNEPLAKHTSWRIGGPAEYFFLPDTEEELRDFLLFLPKTIKILWLGSGSNILAPDEGIKAAIICQKKLRELVINQQIVKASVGVKCAELVQFCLRNNLVDGVFLAGIPGTIGGALAMNAGAFGHDFWQHVVAVDTINREGKISHRGASEFKASYREVTGLKKDEWFLNCYLKFSLGDTAIAKHQIKELWQKRLATQPLREPTCGSVFKNPPGTFAGKLIEDCGLKGFKLGGAKVSEKHANFIVNAGNASAKDIKKLINFIKSKVYDRFRVELSLEVKIWYE